MQLKEIAFKYKGIRLPYKAYSFLTGIIIVVALLLAQAIGGSCTVKQKWDLLLSKAPCNQVPISVPD